MFNVYNKTLLEAELFESLIRLADQSQPIDSGPMGAADISDALPKYADFKTFTPIIEACKIPDELGMNIVMMVSGAQAPASRTVNLQWISQCIPRNPKLESIFNASCKRFDADIREKLLSATVMGIDGKRHPLRITNPMVVPICTIQPAT